MIALLSLFCLALAHAEEVDLLFLVQASAALIDDREVVGRSIDRAVTNLIDAGHDVRSGVASFVDKPNVGVGVGNYGGWPAGYNMDYCYRLHEPFSHNHTDLVSTIVSLPRQSGLEVYEAHTEALVRAAQDTLLLWREKARRMVVLFTNTLPHSGEFEPLISYVSQFNLPLDCRTQLEGVTYTVGGFGSQVQEPVIPGLLMWTPYTDEYEDYADLLVRQSCGGELSEGEEARLALYKRAVFAPTKVDAVKPFNNAELILDPETHCRTNEYPSWHQTVERLEASQIELVIALVDLPSTRAATLDRKALPVGFLSSHSDKSVYSYEVVWDWILCDAEAMAAIEADLFFLPQGNDQLFSTLLSETLQGSRHTSCGDQPVVPSPATQPATSSNAIMQTAPSTRASTTPAEACTNLQVVALMDASGSWSNRGGEVSQKLAEALYTIKQVYPTSQIGLSSFVDKPSVGHGFGSYGGYRATDETADWCYRSMQTLSSSVTVKDMETLIMTQQWGWGMDAAEGTMEALLNTVYDPSMGWKPKGQSQKVILILTDDIAHAGVDYLPISEPVDDFNDEVQCVDGTTTGGFGALRTNERDLSRWTSNVTTYNEYAELIRSEICEKQQLSDAENRQRLALEELLSPYKLPAIKPFDMQKLRSDPEAHCRENEYPDYNTVRAALIDNDVKLVVLVLDFQTQGRRLADGDLEVSVNATQHRRYVPVEELPAKMSKLLSRVSSHSAAEPSAAARGAAVTISDVWQWVLTDDDALGGTDSYQSTVVPEQVASFVGPVVTGLAGLTRACF